MSDSIADVTGRVVWVQQQADRFLVQLDNDDAPTDGFRFMKDGVGNEDYPDYRNSLELALEAMARSWKVKVKTQIQFEPGKQGSVAAEVLRTTAQ